MRTPACHGTLDQRIGRRSREERRPAWTCNTSQRNQMPGYGAWMVAVVHEVQASTDMISRTCYLRVC
eukprot:11793085-Alexandrium_andersonii.AAC.1